VAHGEFVSIIGPNGAGKSTILKSVMRLLPVDRGRIEIDGHALSGLGQRQLAQTVSYVPQELRGTMPWTVREFVLMGRYPYVSTFREYSRRDQQVVDEVMALTGVTPLADREMTPAAAGRARHLP
jgi:iron complex transport system ATP-binding protein